MSVVATTQRLRQAILRSTKEVGEALSRAFKFDESAKLASALPLGEALGGEHAGDESAAANPEAPGASMPTVRYPSSEEKKGVARLLHYASFVGNGQDSYDVTTVGGSFEGKDRNMIGAPANRLEESEGWFIADLIGGRVENEGIVAREENSHSQIMVMVSSAGSVSSMQKEVEERTRGLKDDFDAEESQELVLPFLYKEQLKSQSQIPQSSCSSMIEALEQQLNTEKTSLLSEGQEISAICVEKANVIGLIGQSSRLFYKADAGNGWDSFSSLQELLDFLRKAAKIYGPKALRSMRFWLPLAESEKFLDQLEEIAPYTLEDFIRASSAAATPLAFTALARYCVSQLAEFVLSWGVVEGAAAAAGESTAASGVTSAAVGICPTFATVTLMVVAGVGVYAVVRFVSRLKNVRRKLIVSTDVEEFDAEAPQPTRSKHCLIKWK